MRDVRRLADAAGSVAALAGDLRRELRPFIGSIDHSVRTLDSMRDEIAGLRAALDPMSDDLDALRASFAATTDELQRIREAFAPELGGVRVAAVGLQEEVRRQRELIDALDSTVKELGHLVTAGISKLIDTLRPLVRDADDVREVVEPLQTATERVGRLAERLPGPGRKR
jgi:ABC-type transporter Mla subunit MlaD